MRIAHICPFVGEQMGGSERYASNLANLFSSDSDVHIYTTTRFPHKVGTEVVKGVSFHRFYSPITFWNINPLCLMVHGLAKSNADIFHIHSHLYLSSNQAVIAKLLKAGKALLQLHGGVGMPPYRTSYSKRITKLIYDRSVGKFTIKGSDMIASVSRLDLKTIASSYDIPKNRLCYLPNVVDTKKFKPDSNRMSDRPTVITYLGDLEPWKGVMSLIRWLRDFDHSYQDELTFRFIGQGTLYPHLQEMSEYHKNNGSNLNLEVLGQRKHEEIPSLLQDSKALILPSYWEGMPTVILEAMATGALVITTPVGDIPRVIHDKVTGLIIQRRKDSFRSAVEFVQKQDAKVRQISSNARKLVEREFSIEHLRNQAGSIYRKLMNT